MSNATKTAKKLKKGYSIVIVTPMDEKRQVEEHAIVNNMIIPFGKKVAIKNEDIEFLKSRKEPSLQSKRAGQGLWRPVYNVQIIEKG